jgi:hypothetical protein
MARYETDDLPSVFSAVKPGMFMNASVSVLPLQHSAREWTKKPSGGCLVTAQGAGITAVRGRVQSVHVALVNAVTVADVLGNLFAIPVTEA